MNVLIKIGIIIGILIIISMSIKLLIILGTGIYCIGIKMKYFIEDKIYEKKQNSDKAKEVAADIINQFEHLLSKNNIIIPNEDREGNNDEACIYGKDYYDLEDYIIDVLKKI